jgi:hypothetical protein
LIYSEAAPNSTATGFDRYKYLFISGICTAAC